MAGGIALEHRRQIGAHRRADRRHRRPSLLRNFADRQRAQIVAAQLARPDDRTAPVPAGHAAGWWHGRSRPGRARAAAMASACWRKAVQIGSMDETFSRGVGHQRFLEGGAFTTKVCRISKRPKPGFFRSRLNGPRPLLKVPNVLRQEARPFNHPAPATLDLLLSRRSGSAKAMTTGPSKAAAHPQAGRAPDHGKLFPWRFLFEARARRAGDILANALSGRRRGQAGEEARAARAAGDA